MAERGFSCNFGVIPGVPLTVASADLNGVNSIRSAGTVSLLVVRFARMKDTGIKEEGR